METDHFALRAGPTSSLPARVGISLVRAYQILLSPLWPNTCRFYPSCSQYALEAIRRRGLLKGSWMTLKRLTRCHPFNPGGEDPVE